MDILSLAVVMPQLAEWPPPTSQVCGAKLEHLLPVDETKMNNKRLWMAHFWYPSIDILMMMQVTSDVSTETFH